MKTKLYQNNNKTKLTLSKKDNLFLKELIYCGDFVDGEQEFSIDESKLNHWVETFQKMKANGLRVPIPLGHSFSAEDERGTVVDLFVNNNEHGIKALYGKFDFFDGVDVSVLTNSDVSIEVPAEIKDGQGNIYKEPIRHVALTSYPVIPNLGNFLRLSLINNKMEMKNMKSKKLSQIAKSLNLTDEATIEEIVEAIEKLETDVEEVKEEVVEKSLENSDTEKETLKEEIKKELLEEIKEETLELSDTETEEKKGDEEDEEKKELKLSLLKLSNQNRKLEIENLIKDGYISVGTKKYLEQKYCSDKSKLSLSQIDNNFSDIVSVLKMQGKMRYGEQTQGQVLSCSLNKNDNPLLKDAENRIKK